MVFLWTCLKNVCSLPAVLSDMHMDPEISAQIKRLRTITSVLFACLRQLCFTADDSQPNVQLINDLIGWITCIVSNPWVAISLYPFSYK